MKRNYDVLAQRGEIAIVDQKGERVAINIKSMSPVSINEVLKEIGTCFRNEYDNTLVGIFPGMNILKKSFETKSDMIDYVYDLFIKLA